MSKYQQAEQLVRTVIEDLQKLLPRDGEDISCYNPCVVDTSILDLAKVRTLLGRADEAASSDDAICILLNHFAIERVR